MKRELIKYTHDGEWNGFTLEQMEDGLWRYESWSAIQGCRSGRVVIIRQPDWLHIEDEADMDTGHWPELPKHAILREEGTEVRCLRRGHIVT